MSKTAKVRDPAKYDEILRLPENLVGEIIDGELFVSPRPGKKHIVTTSKLNSKLDNFFGSRGGGGPGGWWTLTEPEVHIDTHVLVPDLAGWKKARMPEIHEGAFFDIVPDWVCEVLSPSNLLLDRAKKVPKYAECNIGYLWLVDPISKTLESYRLENGRWLLLGTFSGDEKFHAEPFEVLEFDLATLWGETTD